LACIDENSDFLKEQVTSLKYNPNKIGLKKNVYRDLDKYGKYYLD